MPIIGLHCIMDSICSWAIILLSNIVLKIDPGTGVQHAIVCLHTLDEWVLKSQVRSLVFDTRCQKPACAPTHAQYFSRLWDEMLCEFAADTMFLKSLLP